ncbi:hypothetical protein HJFPF1_05948 [Paramyrothecium foliicola]|nr:hypothetical protein HJFPF1_05948 [Paramyrothecium foliicola]
MAMDMGDTLPAQVLAKIPGSTICANTLQLSRKGQLEPIFNHSIRVYLIAQWLAEKEGSEWTQPQRLDLLFVAAAFHDYGVSSHVHDPQRFEVCGADMAERQLEMDGGFTPEDCRRVWIAIAVHTSPGIAERIDPLARLLRLAVKSDFSRAFATELGVAAYCDEIEQLLPRLDVERVLAHAVDPSSMPIISGVQWVQTTYEDTSQLAQIFAGIHTVLSFVDPVRDPVGDVQKRLIDAAVEAGVKRFAPSEWSIGRKLEDCLDDIPWYASKNIIRKYLEKVNSEKKILEYSLFQPGFFLNYLGYPNPTTRHVTLFPVLFDFHCLRTIVVEEDLHARISFTTVQDIAGVVARAIEYDGEWPVYGGITGSTATVAEILALGEKIKGYPFTVRWVKKADIEAGTADLSPISDETHPTIAGLPKQQREEILQVVPKGLLTTVGVSAWETTGEWNRLLPDYEFTTIKAFLQQVWGTTK